MQRGGKERKGRPGRKWEQDVSDWLENNILEPVEERWTGQRIVRSPGQQRPVEIR